MSVNLLFLCTGNACRSQMAEGWAKYFAASKPDLDINIESAGIEAHGKNPRAIQVMQEAGVDISNQESTKVTDDMINRATIVITVCGNADEHCPALPTYVKKIHWPLTDPAKATGSEEEIMEAFRNTRDDVRRRVMLLLDTLPVMA